METSFLVTWSTGGRVTLYIFIWCAFSCSKSNLIIISSIIITILYLFCIYFMVELFQACFKPLNRFVSISYPIIIFNLTGAPTLSWSTIIIVIIRRLDWLNFSITVSGSKSIQVVNVSNDSKENLETKDRIIKVSLGHRHLVVATTIKCYIYKY